MTLAEIKHLYYGQGLSCREVGEKAGLTVWQVIGLMKRNNLKLRSSSKTQRIQFSKKPLSFHQKYKLTPKEQKLHLAGHVIYWAEGMKFGDHVVDLANSDKDMIKLFLSMLREVYQVKESKLRVLLYCYANQNSAELINYWSRELAIPENQFIKPYIRSDFNPDKTYKMPYGLVHIRYHDKKLFIKIKKEIDIIRNLH